MGKLRTADGSTNKLAAQIRTIADQYQDNGKRVKVNRAFIFDRATGQMLKTLTVFIDSIFGKSPSNTPVSILRDLAFFHEWKLMKSERDKDWIPPEVRAARERSPLTPQEIMDFCRWCHWSAKALVNARRQQMKAPNVRVLPSGSSVESKTAKHKIIYTSKYLIWLAESLIPETTETPNKHFQPGSVVARKIRAEFDKHTPTESKYLPPASLTTDQRKELRSAVNTEPHTDFVRRDQLIVRLLMEGVRPGELLKVRTHDVSERTEIDSGRYCATVRIARRPNDPDDPRPREPAVKTLSGLLPIASKLATDLINYVIDARRRALDLAESKLDHTLLFVSHEGKTMGQPLSQRSVNRIIAKYKGIGQIPATLAPRILRHTHMTEVEEVLSRQGSSQGKRRNILLQRGRWSAESEMPGYYTGREHIRQSADAVENRDRILYGNDHKV